MKRFALASVIAAGAIILPLSSKAQQPAMPVIGFLTTASSKTRSGDLVTAFQLGLKEAGYIENQNVSIEYRWADDDYSRLPALAADLVRLRVAVIVAAGGHVTALAAHNITKDIPIVFTTVTDPVKEGLVASLNKPGGNVTGTAGLTQELDPKRLELMHDLKPTASVIGVLMNPKRPGVDIQWRELQAAAERLNLRLVFGEASNEREIDTAFAKFASQHVEALVVAADPFFNNRREQVIAHAARLSVPAIYQWREFVLAGGLMSYGPSITEAYRQAGINAARILKGEKPSDMPVVRPTRFQMVVNGATAKRLGLTLSPSLLSRVDEVIE